MLSVETHIYVMRKEIILKSELINIILKLLIDIESIFILFIIF